jgi:coproporphyrinogen III oxidase-like Fe-S oxidoreductase
MTWEYKVVPFAAASKSGANREEAVAAQFSQLLAFVSNEGFEYYRMDHYSLFEQPGCLAALFGAKATVLTYDVAIFRRQKK